MRKGFSLLELMVACLLLGMLVTALTMIFNSSSIAWRTGTAGVAELKNVRTELGTMHDIMDDMLPGLSGRDDLRTVSLWDPDQDNQLRTDRAYDTIQWGRVSPISVNDAKTAALRTLNGAGNGNGSGLFTVGVMSLGPDGKQDTEDDVTTWPEVN